jgi:hypothetical protein
MKRAANAEQWKKHLLERGLSGQSKAEFCRVRGLNTSSYDYWERKLRVVGISKPATASSGFARVKVESLAKTASVSIRFGCGVVVESSGGYPTPSWVASVARELSEGVR